MYIAGIEGVYIAFALMGTDLPHAGSFKKAFLAFKKLCIRDQGEGVFFAYPVDLIGHLPGVTTVITVFFVKFRGTVAHGGQDALVAVVGFQKALPLA